jgi:hypothetical protein
MLAKPADPYDLLRDNWVGDDPHVYVQLTAVWLEAADAYADVAGTQLVDDIPGNELVAEVNMNAMKNFPRLAHAAERRAAVMADTIRLIVETRLELTRLCREGTGAIAAAADGGELIDKYRSEIRAAKEAYDQVMTEPGRARRVPMIAVAGMVTETEQC